MYELSEFLALCKKYRLKPVLLETIFHYRVRGYNNVEISGRTGINKNTLNKYVTALTRFSDEEIDLIMKCQLLI